MTTRTPVILCSPCAPTGPGTLERNRMYANDCMRDSIGRNEAPLASHVLYAFSEVLDDNIHGEREMGLDCEAAWLPLAKRVVVYGDLGNPSSGMAKAMALADALGIPVERRSLPQWANVSRENERVSA